MSHNLHKIIKYPVFFLTKLIFGVYLEVRSQTATLSDRLWLSEAARYYTLSDNNLLDTKHLEVRSQIASLSDRLRLLENHVVNVISLTSVSSQ